MAAGDFSPSALYDVQAKLLEMFGANTPAENRFRDSETLFGTANALLTNQTAIVSDVLKGGQCIGVEAKYLAGAGANLTTNETTATAANADLGGCNLVGVEHESETVTYQNNLFIAATNAVDDNLCNNVYQFQDLSAAALRDAINTVRKTLNTRATAFLTATAQNNLDTNIANYNTGNGAWSAAGANITMASADVNTPDSLAFVDIAAMNNQLREYFLLHGPLHYYAANYNADFKAQNDNGRDIRAAFLGNKPSFWDVRGLAGVNNGRVTFAVNPDAYVFWNRAWSTPAPVQIDENKFAFTVTDPLFVYMNNGVPTPLTYEIVYQKVCTGRGPLTQHVLEHRWEVKLIGGLAAAPAGSFGETGVLRFISTAGN
jgi:hypothetical protein